MFSSYLKKKWEIIPRPARVILHVISLPIFIIGGGFVIILALFLIIFVIFGLPGMLLAYYEFSQTIPKHDTQRIIAVAVRDLLDSHLFRNHHKNTIPYTCEVTSDNEARLALKAAGFEFDQIVVCKVPINCGGYKFEDHSVYYILGVRIPGDWGSTGGLYEYDGNHADSSKMINCDYIE